MGYAVPGGNFNAEIHSVFTSAVNLRLAKGSRLITLVTIQEADLPQGIRLNSSEGFTFEGLRRGDQFTCQNGILHCETAPMVVDLRQAQRWKCNLSAFARERNIPSSLIARQRVSRALNERWAQVENDVSTAISEMAKIIPNLITATRRYDDLAAADSVKGLVGLGPGLTPAGDDFLVGYLAGLWCAAGEKTDCLRFLSHLRKMVIVLSERTNDISRTYLHHAAHGQVSSRLADLADAICRGANADQLLVAAEASMRVGHLSGLEATTGLLMGLSVWEESDSQDWNPAPYPPPR
jgi:hypothetical protein